MSAGLERLLDYGVLGIIVFVCIGGFIWIAKYVMIQLFSRDEKREGLAVMWMRSSASKDRKMEAFMDSLAERDERQDKILVAQQELCHRHMESQEKISGLLALHDQVESQRSETLEELVEWHKDASIPHSTAQAIHNVAQLKLAAMTACNGCREAANGMDLPIREVVIRHCEEIKKILKTTG